MNLDLALARGRVEGQPQRSESDGEVGEPAMQSAMSDVVCRKDASLTAQEKQVFSASLEHDGLSENIWDLFDEWVQRSTSRVQFLYLKAYSASELVGMGMFIRIKPVDLRSSYAGLRHNPYLSKIAGVVSALGNNCLVVTLRNLVTANMTRPFFFRDPQSDRRIMAAFLSALKDERGADMVTIIDTTNHAEHYRAAGFDAYPCSSEAYFDATQYQDVAEYLRGHRSLRRNLRRRKEGIVTSIQPGPVSAEDIAQMRACVECSVKNSRVANPCQQFFEENIFQTELFRSDKYLHILVRVDGRIAGFHIFQVCGSHMGGVFGGFNRDYSRNNFVYERVIVASLDYAIQNGLGRVWYSLIDNHTKLRLVESREPSALYFFAPNPLVRKVFGLTYPYSDVNQLSLLEQPNETFDAQAATRDPG